MSGRFTALDPEFVQQCLSVWALASLNAHLRPEEIETMKSICEKAQKGRVAKGLLHEAKRVVHKAHAKREHHKIITHAQGLIALQKGEMVRVQGHE